MVDGACQQRREAEHVRQQGEPAVVDVALDARLLAAVQEGCIRGALEGCIRDTGTSTVHQQYNRVKSGVHQRHIRGTSAVHQQYISGTSAVH